MYSGTTVGKSSGNFFGAHQRIDKIARKHLTPLLETGQTFPSIKQILYFEGNNGPDAVKRKSPSIDEPWHYIDPKKMHDISLIDMIHDHIENLARALKDKNDERAAFEAAWLAHAVVDGLTPAHHFPLAEKIEELFGMPHHERTTVKQKNIIKGTGRRDTVAKNWEYWGSGGIFSSHFLFEFGVSTGMIGKAYKSTITDNDLVDIKLKGYDDLFHGYIHEVADMDIYDKFQIQGWSLKVTRLVQKRLIPLINKAVCLAWYAAVVRSEDL